MLISTPINLHTFSKLKVISSLGKSVVPWWSATLAVAPVSSHIRAAA